MGKVVIKNGKAYVFDERWITINADPDNPGQGQHVLIKENGTIVAGLGGRFKSLSDLSNGKKEQNYVEPKSDKLSDEERNIMNSKPYTKILLNEIEGLYNIPYNPVKERANVLSDEEIIDLVSGGDETSGSCLSVAMAYIGQKHGLDVRDYRGWHSQECFSYSWTLNAIASAFPNQDSVFREDSNVEMTAGKRLLKNIKEGKEYILSVGAHAAIVRKKNGRTQYLQLQSETDSGWKNFNQDPTITLEKRFGCSKHSKKLKGTKHTILHSGVLIDIDKFKDLKEFKITLGYINTAPENEIKGKKGYPK